MNKQEFFDALRHLDVAQFEVSYYQVRELEVPRSTAFVIVSGGDGLVDTANRQTFEAEYEDASNDIPLETVGKDLVAVEDHPLNPAESEHYATLIDWVEALANYPLASEEKHSELELEAIEESWNDWAAHDFTEALENAADSEMLGYILDWSTEDDVFELALRGLFDAAREAANEYWTEDSGGGMYINMDKVVNAVTRDMLVEHYYEKLSDESCRFIVEAIMHDWGKCIERSNAHTHAITTAMNYLNVYRRDRSDLIIATAVPAGYALTTSKESHFHLEPHAQVVYPPYGNYAVPAIAVRHTASMMLVRAFHPADIGVAVEMVRYLIGKGSNDPDDPGMIAAINAFLKERAIPLFHDGQPLGGER